MSDDLIERLRAGLEGVTPGPYLVLAPRDKRDTADFYIARNENDVYEGWVGETATLLDALHFSRCHPENIRILLDALAAKDTALSEVAKERDAFEAGCEYWSSETARVCGEASALAAKLEQARKALEPFAKFSTHKTSYVELPVRWCIDAARALASIQETAQPLIPEHGGEE